MNEQGTDFFNESTDETIIDAEEIPKYEGICSSCLGSHYRMQERNGVLGVLYTSNNMDSEGRPIKRLIPCDCNVEVTY